MMEQLLERDGTQDQQPILAEVIEHEIDRSYDVDDTAHNSQVSLVLSRLSSRRTPSPSYLSR